MVVSLATVQEDDAVAAKAKMQEDVPSSADAAVNPDAVAIKPSDDSGGSPEPTSSAGSGKSPAPVRPFFLPSIPS
jgi:hypothetical protein